MPCIQQRLLHKCMGIMQGASSNCHVFLTPFVEVRGKRCQNKKIYRLQLITVKLNYYVSAGLTTFSMSDNFKVSPNACCQGAQKSSILQLSCSIELTIGSCYSKIVYCTKSLWGVILGVKWRLYVKIGKVRNKQPYRFAKKLWQSYI